MAFLIVPPATAYLLTEHLSRMMILAVALGAASAVAGYYLAAILDVAIAGMMAVVAGALFVLALLLSPSRGLVANLLRQRRNRRSFARDLLLAGLEKLDGHATEEELARRLDWEKGSLSRTLGDASRDGFVHRSAPGEVALTEKGRSTVCRLSGEYASVLSTQ